MFDSVSDLIIRLKNANLNHKDGVTIPYSKLKEEILKVMNSNGYINEIKVVKIKEKKSIVVSINNFKISHIKRISKPGRRYYSKFKDIPKPLRGLGLIIISTPKGILSGKDARKLKVGGELICEVW